jgi:hypothetical protein
MLIPTQVRKLLDLVQSKGEEVSEFFLFVLQQLADAYVDLRPWLVEISFSPSQIIQSKTVVNTDPGMSQPQAEGMGWEQALTTKGLQTILENDGDVLELNCSGICTTL